MSIRWLACYFLFAAPVFVQGWFAWRDNLLTVAQMQTYHGNQGIPFLHHHGMWGDVFLLGPVLATIVVWHGHKWNVVNVAWAALLGFALSAVMHWTYTQIQHPEAHVHDGYLTEAGITHLWYMAACLTVLVLYYLTTPGLNLYELAVVGVLLWVHMFFGVHAVLRIVGPQWFPMGYMWDAGAIGPLVAVPVILALTSWWALRA